MALTLDRQNRYRERYRQQHPGWRPTTEVYEDIILQQLRPGMRVLDLGCGRGGVLEQVGAAIDLPLGFDPDLASLREHRLPALPRAQALADRLPLCAASLDLILSSWVFEHLATPLVTFQEMRRVLRAGGRVVFMTPNRDSLVVALNRGLRPVQHRLVKRLYGREEADTFPILYRANTRDQIMRLAAEAGLHCESLHGIHDPTYLAFHPLLYRISVLLTRVTPPVHWVGVLGAAS
jgi:SAM-dependent methyltransferase